MWNTNIVVTKSIDVNNKLILLTKIIFMFFIITISPLQIYSENIKQPNKKFFMKNYSGLNSIGTNKFHAIMHPDSETLKKWKDNHKKALKAPYDIRFKMYYPQSLTLEQLLKYNPADDQGCCEDCWLWAGTRAMGIDLLTQTSKSDQLSVQYVNSFKNISTYFCKGGDLSALSEFYNKNYKAIPVSNKNAEWQDGFCKCSDIQTCKDFSKSTCIDFNMISTVPNYPIKNITPNSVGGSIDEIKNMLNQKKAVWLGFYLATKEDWTDFNIFWNNKSENDLWNPDKYCGQDWKTKLDKTDLTGGGGHAVLCIGYNEEDPDPAKHYWILVNSWGIAGGMRPNGFFRMPMNINYNCTINYWVDNDRTVYSAMDWEVLDINWK